jgi:carbamoyl-phosphate synthase small subunit
VSNYSVSNTAILALADGSVFRGRAIGACGSAVGEVVFNTAMTGYQEILTDPSYSHQLVTLTYPHIGNVGVNPLDAEADRVFAAGLIIRDASSVASNFRATMSLGEYLATNGVVAIADIDTRRLTRLLRDKGAQNGCISAGENPDVDAALAQARAFAGLKGADLAQVVSTESPYVWREGTWTLEGNTHRTPVTKAGRRVVAYDFGVKRNILRLLADRGCEIEVVPAKTPAEEVFAREPDGVFLSNGPGKFGHHGANHPVQDLQHGNVLITSQNHGFAIDEHGLPANVVATHRSLFDGTLQGIECRDVPAFGFQGHPEASPGPHDIQSLFDRFVASIDAYRS